MRPALPGVERALAWLEDGGVALAVISTNCQPAVRTALHRAGILGRFDAIVARTPALDMANLKPSPFGLNRALDQLQCAPGDAVYVGDSVIDMHAGQAAKIYTIAVPGPLARVLGMAYLALRGMRWHLGRGLNVTTQGLPVR